MKKFTILLFCFVCLSVSAQQWEWARKGDQTTYNEYPKKLRTDGFGNQYLFGNGSGGSKYGSTILAPGYFIVKFDSVGTVLWAQNINCTHSYTDFNVDEYGNIYFTGYYSDSITVFSYHFVSNGRVDMYIIKLDPLGTPAWGRNFGGTGQDVSGRVVIDHDQNVYIDGSFQNSISFDTHTLTDSTEQFFLTKLNSSGNTIWATKGDTSFSYGSLMQLDKYSNIYVFSRGLIAKFDSSGNLLSHGIGGAAQAFVVSDSGNLFLLNNSGGHYGYYPVLVKYDSSMNEKWREYLGSPYGCYQFGADLFLDKSENIYVLTGKLY